MMSVTALTSAAGAASYFEQVDDYYREGAGAPSQWLGEAAAALGLSGEVDQEQFTRLLEGALPNGEQLGRVGQDGQIEHKPGWDCTFSAPKSVSVLSLVGGDERLMRAHDEAVRAAFAHIERECSITRVKDAEGNIHVEKTGNLAAATFRHDTSRAQDPQLHTHAVVMNLTQRKDGQWRSLESREIYRIQKEAGELYRQELAQRVRELGYQIERTMVGDGVKAGVGFEISGVPANLLDAYSTRSAQVEQALAERGKTRETASAAEKEAATLATRDAKEACDRGELKAGWEREAVEHGINPKAMVEQAREVAADPEFKAKLLNEDRDLAEKGVAFAMENLEERQGVFSETRLEKMAIRQAFGVKREMVEAAIEKTLSMGELQQRQVMEYDPEIKEFKVVDGYTTKAAIEVERSMLGVLHGPKQSVGALLPHDQANQILVAAMEKSREAGYEWTASQREATLGILTATERVIGVQGYAGTAKTTTVLKTVAEELQRQGYQVHAMAPTASAAITLGGAIGFEGKTVQRHLNEYKLEQREILQGRNEPEVKQAWIVDEASFLGARQMQELVKSSEEAGARLCIVGDIKQLGSTEYGAPFRQMQEAGMKTVCLDEVVRQTNEYARDAVMHSIEGRAAEALKNIERAGAVKEIVVLNKNGKPDYDASREARVQEITKDYLALSDKERDRTLIVAPGHDDRGQINTAIREGLKAEGKINGTEIKVDTLEAKGMTRAEAKDAFYYEKGDHVRFSRDYTSLGVTKGEYWKVTEVDTKANTLKLERDGKTIEMNPRSQGTKSEVYSTEKQDIAAGDKVVWTRNDKDKGLVNGQALTVKDINAGKATLQTENGKQVKVDLAKAEDRHLHHAYATTAHAAQGRTTHRVFVHAESHRVNLTNQKSFYVSISRAKEEVRVYTDDRKSLTNAIQTRAAEKQTALEKTPPAMEKAKDAAKDLSQPKVPQQPKQEKDYGIER